MTPTISTNNLPQKRSRTESNILLLIGYVICTAILTGAFYFGFMFFILIASIFGDPTPLYIIVFTAPQVILLPIFYYLYQKDNGRIKLLEKIVLLLLTLLFIYILFFFILPKISRSL